MVTKTEPYAGDTKSSPVIATIIGTIISCILAAGIIIAYIPEQPPIWGSIMWLGIAGALDSHFNSTPSQEKALRLESVFQSSEMGISLYPGIDRYGRVCHRI